MDNEIEELAKRLRVIAIGEEGTGMYGLWEDLDHESRMPYLKQANYVISIFRPGPAKVLSVEELEKIIGDVHYKLFGTGAKAGDLHRMAAEAVYAAQTGETS